jgi:hypothetical protein
MQGTQVAGGNRLCASAAAADRARTAAIARAQGQPLEAKKRVPDAVVVQQLLAGARQDDAARLEHVGVLRDVERHRDVLLDEEALSS